MEEYLQQLTIKTAFNLLAESPENVLACLAKYVKEEWLQKLLNGEIVENFLKNIEFAPFDIQMLCLKYIEKQAELEKRKEVNAGPRFFELSGNGEIIRLCKEIEEVKKTLLTACQNFTICQYYLNHVKDEHLIPGYTFLLAYAQCRQQVNVLVYRKNSTNTGSLLLDECRFFGHEKRSITLLSTAASFLDYVELNIPFSHQQDQRYQKERESYLQSLSVTTLNSSMLSPAI